MSIKSVEIKIIGKMIWVKKSNQWFVSELSLTPDNDNNKDLEREIKTEVKNEIIKKNKNN